MYVMIFYNTENSRDKWCGSLKMNTGFIRGILRGVRYAKSLRVLHIEGLPPGPLLYCTQE